MNKNTKKTLRTPEKHEEHIKNNKSISNLCEINYNVHMKIVNIFVKSGEIGMEILKKSIAGTMESSDCLITITPSQDYGIAIEIESTVKKQFGKQIEKVIVETLKEMNVKNVAVKVNDKGALDCVIVARLKTAIVRSSGQDIFNWGV